MKLPTYIRSSWVRSSAVPLLVATGMLFVGGVPAAHANVVVTNPSSLDDVLFNCLKGQGPGCATSIEENWTVEGDGRTGANAFTRINEWTSNSTFTPRDQENQLWPYGQQVPFTVDYIKASEKVTFTLNFGGSIGTKVSEFAPLTRSPAIDSLYIRVASGSNNTTFQSSLSNLLLTTQPGTSSAQTFSLGSLGANGLASGREVKYAVVTGLPDADFSLSGNAFFDGTARGGNWQIKAAYTVPGPLPILGGVAAFGWSRKLRQRTRR